jgi:hypothetical protein
VSEQALTVPLVAGLAPNASMKISEPALHAFMTVAEAAAEARISSKRLRNLMSAGVLREGTHFTRPPGLRPRIRREALLSWLNGDAGPKPDPSSRPARSRNKLNPELLTVSTRRSKR